MTATDGLRLDAYAVSGDRGEVIESFFANELDEFCRQHPSDVPISETDLIETYTKSTKYLKYTIAFHFNPYVLMFMKTAFGRQEKADIIDVGCCSGFTGLMLAIRGHRVTFHDFEGVGLDFIRWVSNRHNLDTTVIPYGDPVECRYDIAVALDVMEHTGNHLGFVRWISELARRVVVCYPRMEFSPPYVTVVDEWIDDEGVRMGIGSRYNVIVDYEGGGRRFMIWEEKLKYNDS